MDWMGLEKIVKKFDLFGIQTHPIPLNPHGLRANRTSPEEECTHAVHQGNCFVVLSDRFQRNGEPVSLKKGGGGGWGGGRPHQRRGADEQKMLAVTPSPAASNERVLGI
jgi:hypothetical protein